MPGNHEFYGSSLRSIDVLRSLCRSTGVVLLEPGVRHLVDGRSIVGATLWFNQPSLGEGDSLITDYHVIRNFVPDVYHENRRHLTWLNSAVKEGAIVLTHHLPARGSIAAQYADSDLNKFFLCNVEPLILDRKPALWLHGHTHSCFDYMVGSTRIVANPAGYPNGIRNALENAGFDATLVVEL